LQPALPPQRQQIAEVLLTAVKLPAPKRWNVDPAAERKQRLNGQIAQIAQAIWNRSWNVSTQVFETSKEGQLSFKKDLLTSLVQAKQLAPQFLEGPFGGKLTLEEISQLEPSLTADNLAKGVTLQRMNQVYWAVVNYTNQHRDQYLKKDKWVLDDKVITAALKNQNNDGSWTKDAWGSALRILAQDQPTKNPWGQPQFQFHELISAGPDRKFGTKDDLKVADVQATQRFGGMWWLAEDERLGLPTGMLMRRGAGGGFGGGPVRMFGLARDGAMAPMAAAARELKSEAAQQGLPTSSTGTGSQAPGVKVREFFPETMLWQPALITDDRGVADLAVNFADSITTWRLSASANSLGGALGGVNVPLKVFQDFFVDIDLPVNLTQTDEVAFPVAVYNYLKIPQTVKLELQQEPWFELVDGDGLTRSLDLKPNEVTSVKFRIRAGKIGFQSLTVKAFGSNKSDAVKRVVEVVPNGERFEKIVTDRLSGKVNQTIAIPAGAIADASKLFVRLYPGLMSQVMDGMEGMMRMPGGCFEQTSSSAYPNILVIDYIKKTKMTSPQILLKAEEYLNVGYQRLLTFERPGGGFDWWGSGEPLIWLSAYGLQEFSDMARVYPVDRGIIDRTQAFLMKKMDKDGTWSNIGATHGETIVNMGNPKLLLTSYVTWSLLESGVAREQMKQSIEYIRGHLDDADNNAYILALAANALAAYDAKDDSTLQVLGRLEKQRKDLPEWRAAHYPTSRQSITYARGDSVNVETTALTVLAMVKTGQFTNSVNQALTYLVKSKGNGSWGTTSATILALKALLAGMGGPKIKDRINFTVTVDGKQAGQGAITEDNADVLRAFDLKVEPGTHRVQIVVDGEANLMYQIVGRYFEPWKKDTHTAPAKGFDIDVAYDRTRLAVSDVIHAKATLKYKGDLPANMVMLDLGIPPGFTVDAGDFAEMVGKKQVNKFSITSRQVILYLSDLRPGDVKSFAYTLRAKYPLRARTPSTVAYEYYTPDNRAVARPVELVVEEGKK
ncbi:MAG TPA: alpha-2-macroglobulin family protein, partial [Gemmataceae bacterium]|nr:alpha-2-macroglobulin family protein [Gemmataceae bacterium]